MNPADDNKKNSIDNAMKMYGGQGQETAPTPEQLQYAQYQQYQQYYSQFPNPGYGYPAGAAGLQAQPYYNPQYQHYYQQMYGQQQQSQHFQYGVYPSQQANYYNQQAYGYARPPVAPAGYAAAATPANKQVPPKAEAPKQNDPNYDPLLEEIKRTVLNEQKLQKKSRWSAEAVVPGDIHEYFDKKPEKKRIEYEVLNLFSDEKKGGFLEYVRKSFDKCQNAKDQQQMTQMLLATMNEFIQKKTIDTVKWENLPFPVLSKDNASIQKPAPQAAQQVVISNPLNSFNPFNIPGFSLPNTASSSSSTQQISQFQQQNQLQQLSTFQFLQYLFQITARSEISYSNLFPLPSSTSFISFNNILFQISFSLLSLSTSYMNKIITILLYDYCSNLKSEYYFRISYLQ